jgi:magnesium chelatase family protein
MFATVVSAATVGIEAYLVRIECTAATGLLKFSVVGLPDTAVRESVYRITSAIETTGFGLPKHHYTVNLAPADVRKEGSAFDLPTAMALLGSTGRITLEHADSFLVAGELALDGILRPVRGALVLALEAKRQGIPRMILPRQNAHEAALVEGLEVFPASDLQEAIGILGQNGRGTAPTAIDREKVFRQEGRRGSDLQDVRGQEGVKRALEVAAAGGHNLLMIGPPGSGKTMLAKRLPSILPPMQFDEALETTKIHSVAGLLPRSGSLVVRRPFRSPHHTISDSALVGGGSIPRPGEISLAHHGVLFLDELPEFARNVLEVLRQPLEEGLVSISRSRMTVVYPARFMLVSAMNPCPCGQFGNPMARCQCTPMQIQRYLARISGPLLDRIDLHVEVPPVKHLELMSKRAGECSEQVRTRVQMARTRQRERLTGIVGRHCNADMESAEIQRFCRLDDTGQQLLRRAMESLGLSARAYDKILKVARTIADLALSEAIEVQHLSEAVQYRSLDRTFGRAGERIRGGLSDSQ